MELIHFLLGIFVCTSGLFVFLTENPVHSVLFLILTFFNSSAILLLLNADFLALIFVIVYVGAIAVLFLFVVMMLNIKSPTSSSAYHPLAFLGSIFLIIQIFLGLEKSYTSWSFWTLDSFNNTFITFDSTSNIEVLGQSLFNLFLLPFLLAGIILLVAMLGAINLTLNFSSQRKGEISFRQLSRSDKFLSFFK
jgi:NADH-quinone oxidoreductase subunit J